MKNIKIITLTFVFTLVLCVAGSVYGALLFSTDGKAQVIVPQPITQSSCLSISEQIAKGYKYDICTGEKLPASFSPDLVEARFQAIEARLNKLEAKK
jgi:hypothetical protein